MSTPNEANKAVVRSIYEQALNQGRLELIDEIVSPAYVGPRGERGPAAMRAVLSGLRTGFPDIHYTIDELLAEGDRVAVRWTWKGTHTGTLVGPALTLAPTQATVNESGMAVYQLEGGRIVSAKMENDRLGFLMQVGFLPRDLLASPARR